MIHLPSVTNLHIAGSVNRALQEVPTEFVYVLQHDFPFAKKIDHTNLVKSFREYPDILRNIRFEYKRVIDGPRCPHYNKTGSTPVDHVNGLDFTLAVKWSDK